MNADPSSAVQSLGSPAPKVVGVVAIGRNEGDRLKCCLESVLSFTDQVVYVDSGSSDDSVAMSRARGVEVVELDLSIPFTAARARNEGFRKLFEMRPNLNYVFFVDGDCEVAEGWLDKACGFLDRHPDVAVVWGRRRERYPDKSLYNMLCDLEWNSYPLGEVKACGGDAVMRVGAFREVNGYRADLICGEEPELCVRLRRNDWRIWHVDEPMTLHDAAVYRFGQWWKRMLRGGYGFAQGAALHGAPPERHWVWESRGAWVWGLFFPVIVLALALVSGSWALLLLLIYPLQVIRLALRGRGTTRENWWRAGALVLCKFPEMLGQLKFVVNRYRNVQTRLIEYK
jgi:cellulose synthase/poly-beta-1,6-N-acetylglucosamine synthase-like glycosyltransferase